MKLQGPTYKLQRSVKFQMELVLGGLEFGIWNFSGVWMLVLGI